MKLLHLDSSIMGEQSASRTISAAVVDGIRRANPDLDIVYRDLAAEPIPHMTLDIFTALDRGMEVQEFLDADIVVIGVGFYNFSIPSQLKAWIDRIAVRGKTFAYGETGPIGLVTGKRVIVAIARGNVYGEGSPYQAFEHAESLLRSVFSFVGVTDLEFIVAEGLGRGEDVRRAAIDGAIDRAGELSRSHDASAVATL